MSTPADERITPDDWPRALADIDGPQLVVAGPGAGKSEFLTQRAAHLLDEEGLPASSVLVLTFSRRSAANLKSRIADATNTQTSGLGVSTFHSFAYRFAELHAPRALGWSEMPTILTGPEQVSLASELLTNGPAASWPRPFRDMLGSRTLASEVTDFVLRARERLIGPAELAELALGRDDWRALPEFMLAYDEELRSRGRIDYGTLQATAVRLLEDPETRQAAADQFHYILVD